MPHQHTGTDLDPIWLIMRLEHRLKFRDRNDINEQIWGPKEMICKFRNRDDIAKQVWEPKIAITSLVTGMTQSHKFEDRWCTLLFLFYGVIYMCCVILLMKIVWKCCYVPIWKGCMWTMNDLFGLECKWITNRHNICPSLIKSVDLGRSNLTLD